MKLGTQNITGMYLGGVPITKAYLGTQELFSTIISPSGNLVGFKVPWTSTVFAAPGINVNYARTFCTLVDPARIASESTINVTVNNTKTAMCSLDVTYTDPTYLIFHIFPYSVDGVPTNVFPVQLTDTITGVAFYIQPAWIKPTLSFLGVPEAASMPTEWTGSISLDLMDFATALRPPGAPVTIFYTSDNSRWTPGAILSNYFPGEDGIFCQYTSNGYFWPFYPWEAVCDACIWTGQSAGVALLSREELLINNPTVSFPNPVQFNATMQLDWEDSCTPVEKHHLWSSPGASVPSGTQLLIE